MNSFLISLGATLVLALTVALFGPSFVDWNAYRGIAQSEAAKLFGRQVEISGDLDLALLPVPVVRTGAISLQGSDARPVATADSARLSLALGPLILGRVDVTELELQRPALHLDRLFADAGESGPDRGGGAVPYGVLKRIEAKDASLLFTDPLDGRERMLERVDFAVAAGSPRGPFKVTGSYGEGENADRPTFSVSFGSINPGAPVKLTGRAALEGFGNLAVDGEIGRLASERRFNGRVRLERTLSDAKDAAGGKFLIETIADVGLGDAKLERIKISMLRGANGLSVGGAGRLSWLGDPTFRFALDARQVDLDGLVARGDGNEATAGDLAPLLRSLDGFLADRGANGEIQLTLGGAVWRGELVRDIDLKLAVLQDSVIIENLTGMFPGETQLSLTGTVGLGGTPTFAGSIVAETIGASRLVDWLAPRDAAWVGELLASTRGKLAIRARARANQTVLAVDEIDGLIDTNPFSGSVSLEAIGDRRHLQAALAFDHLDLDRYLGPGTGMSDLLDVTTSPAAAEPLLPELSVDLSAKRVSFRSRQAEGIKVAATYLGGALDIAEVEIGDFAGSSLSAEGRIEPSPDGPVGTLNVNIESESLPGLIEALDLPIGDAGVLSALKLDVADVALSVASDRFEDGNRVTASLSGDFAGVAAELTLDTDTSIPRLGEGTMRLTGTLSAEDGRDVLGPQGLIPVFASNDPGGPASLAFTANGKTAEGLDASIVLTAYQTHAESTGRLTLEPLGFAGEMRLEAPDSAAAAAAFGFGGSYALGGRETSLTSTVATTEGRLLFEPISGTLAGSDVAGSLSLLPHGTPSADLDFEADFLSLPAVAAVLLSRPTGHATSQQGREAWPSSLIDVRLLDAATLTIDGKVGSLQLAEGFAIEEAEVHARLEDGLFNLDKMAGSLQEGTFQLLGTVESVDHALVLDGAVGVAELPLARLLGDGDGRALANGRISADAEFEARGRSLLSILSSLSAKGTMTIADVDVPRFDAGAVFDIGEIAQTDATMVAAIIGARQDVTELGTLSGEIEGVNGRIKIGPFQVAAGTISGISTSFIDVASRRFDQEIALTRSDAPTGIHLALIHAGSFGDIGREVEITGLPHLGTSRWEEPTTKRPRPVALPRQPALGGPGIGPRGPGLLPDRTGPAQGGVAVPSTANNPPTGLIEQNVIDLPILEPGGNAPADGDAG